MTAKDLLKTLENLREEEFKKFKWYLRQPDVLETYQTMKVFELETADRLKTVDLMVNAFNLHGALKQTKKILAEIPRKDLVQSLPETSSGPEEENPLKTLPEAKASNTALVEPAGVPWSRQGLRKYSCELTIDTNTVNRKIKLSDNNRKATLVEEDQTYFYHPDRFDWRPQLLCTDGLTGRCYWEVEWRGDVCISVSYRGIGRKGEGEDSVFGQNDQSWSLVCSFGGCYFFHNGTKKHISSPSSSSSSSSSGRVAVYVDWPAGSLSFYRVSSDTLIHLHTFNTTFIEPLYPGFALGTPGCSVCLSSV
ncbi:stonustoxin subunit beta-like isoform X2 [Micropterus salmoides]|uniref:stonustoxin subunit beta-like isoform X2 n=1 Tax=Micropterus salmoides TaxID=27706 RepID=UPI0018EB496F|nr:stonustoxin subunit beta-like isoform X2 [Micropterus salmoides]